MPKVYQQPDSDSSRRQTRATNANAHPGRVVMEVLGSRRKQEDIKKDKKAKRERHENREKKKTQKLATVKNIADFEDRMALRNKAEDSSFPRRRTEG